LSVVADAAEAVFLKSDKQEYLPLPRLAKAKEAFLAFQEEAQVPHPQLA
jgi:hypothetical protein